MTLDELIEKSEVLEEDYIGVYINLDKTFIKLASEIVRELLDNNSRFEDFIDVNENCINMLKQKAKEMGIEI